MRIDFGQITLEQFIAEYWQQKPLLIKGGFKNFEDPIAADELAGLACEEDVESRLIYKKDDKWQAESGPFENYDHLGEKEWTLVVQSANHWSDEVAEFTKAFDFIPQWRFDDVMISFATEGGGVGPHVDNYDVFICQGSGNRHWRVGERYNFVEKVAHEKLLHVEPFEAIIDSVVEAGDILYIPPGCPHEGLSKNASMSFSMGYRSTTENDILSNFADYLLDTNKTPKLLADPKRAINKPGQLSNADFVQIKALLLASLNDEERLANFVGQHYSQAMHELDICPSEYSFEEWLALFSEQPLQRVNGLKVIYVDKTLAAGELYINGEPHSIKDASSEMLQHIANEPMLSLIDIKTKKSDVTDKSLLKVLFESTNNGYWYFA